VVIYVKITERLSTRILFQVVFRGAGKGVLKAMELRALSSTLFYIF